MDTITYCGLLDDFALRHDDLAIRTLEELNEHLIAAVLFGGKLVINDGHMLLHPALQEAVVTPDKSPLRHLARTGFVRVLTRNKGMLQDLAHEMATKNIASAQKLLAKPWYKSTFQPAIGSWAEQLRSSAFDAFMPWPNLQTNAVFHSVSRVALQSLEASEPGHAKQFGNFRERLEKTAGRRTEWEEEAGKLVKEAKLFSDVYNSLMRTANEAYQYSWGCVLGTTGNAVQVLTRAPRHLDNFNLAVGELDSSLPKAVTVFVPDLTFAAKAIHHRWELLAETSLPTHPVNQTKQIFLTKLQQYYAAVRSNEKEVQLAARDYGTVLSKHFGKSETIPVVVDLGFLATSTAAGAAFGGPPGILLGVGIGLAGVAVSHLGGPQMLWRLTAPNPKKWIARVKQQPGNLCSSFRLAPAQIAQHTSRALPYAE
jgi:hypothetical protein